MRVSRIYEERSVGSVSELDRVFPLRSFFCLKGTEMRRFAIASVMVFGIGACQEVARPVAPQATTAKDASTSESGDNPESQGHRASSANAPFDQKNPTDDDITAKIVSKMSDTKMAANLENVKVRTPDGKVTLRGLVKTAEEKETVEDIAKDIAGTGNVDSQIEVEQ